METVDARLTAYQSFVDDWDGYGTEAPKLDTIVLARTIAVLALRCGMEIANVSPSVMGGMGMCFVKERRYAGLEILNDGDIEVTLRDKDRQDEYESFNALDETAIKSLLTRVSAFLREGMPDGTVRL